MSIYTNDNVNDSFRKEPDAGKPHVRNSVRGVRPYGVHLLDLLRIEIIRSLFDKEKADIPIVAMTANAFEMGMNDHIAKPIDVEKVEEVLVALLKE